MSARVVSIAKHRSRRPARGRRCLWRSGSQLTGLRTFRDERSDQAPDASERHPLWAEHWLAYACSGSGPLSAATAHPPSEGDHSRSASHGPRSVSDVDCGVRTVWEHARDGKSPLRPHRQRKATARNAIRAARTSKPSRRQRRGTAWRSIGEVRSIATSSSTEVLDFAALRASRASAKPKSSSASSDKRRQRKPNVVKL